MSTSQENTKGTEERHKVFSYLDAEGIGMLEALTRRRKLSRAALIRTLIIEEARREGITVEGL